jgi:predicted CoA-substrate-specific enzyme activase
VTLVEQDGGLRCVQVRHGGDPKGAASQLLAQAAPRDGRPVVVTGRGLRAGIGHRHVSEPLAVQRALAEFRPEELPDAIVSFGGQSILVYELDSKGGIANAHTFNKCGSGTGEFFLQQIRRLGFDGPEEALRAAASGDARSRPYVPAARCSVFCKSDCTHASNEGKATRGQIAAGLCKMISDKIGQLLAKIEARRIWVIGGGSKLDLVLDYLRDEGLEVTTPPHAVCFEAWGASLLASGNGRLHQAGTAGEAPASFSTLPELTQFADLVQFKEIPKGKAQAGDACLLAVDAGSTTTKLVLMRLADRTTVASHYGYTLGRPHVATLAGLAALKEQLGTTPVEIVGIVTTGSGRYLVETFLTDYERTDPFGGLIEQVVAVNEITCHAKAGEHFNPGVACVLEIGGQDAKYTCLVNGVPADFCMNEACSAGTGSFLAEVVKEMFGIDRPEEIAPLAKQSGAPIRFGEQCSAFIEGDINIALQEGASTADVVAGLCYSICYNYINRVVGSRPIRSPISVQGGTAYNQAFCLAMAGVLKMNGHLGEGERIVVSREAGLMGAVGACFELAERIGRGEFRPFRTHLDALLAKQLAEGHRFECQACDYHCPIQTFLVDGHKVPFGGFCRRYDSVRRQRKPVEPADYDLTIRRDALLFDVHSDLGRNLPQNAPRVGLLGTFFDLSYLPFFSHFFSRLGCRAELAREISQQGRDRQGAAFCWPVEQAHGLLGSLLAEGPDFYWLPHIKAVPAENFGDNTRHCCPFIQASPYYLSEAFPELPREKILKPYLDLTAPLDEVARQLQPVAARFGAGEQAVRGIVAEAWSKQQEFQQDCIAEGRKALEWLSEDPSRLAFVLVGRPYNAFTGRLGANKGISRKLAAAGVPVIPLDCLPLDGEEPEGGMYWSSGQLILQGAQLIARHPQLFGVYLTNFSCGPDSFLIYRFREYMGSKPSLTLEFDGHTVNAGFDTRSEAFLDVVNGYRKQAPAAPPRSRAFIPATLGHEDGKRWYNDSDGRRRPLTDPAVRMVYSDMGPFNSQAISAATESLGIHSVALPAVDESCVQLGRRFASCKECLPYHGTLGGILQHAGERPKDELSLVFMPDATGPCRFGQYNVYLRRVIENLEVRNTAVVTLSPRDAYAGLGGSFQERAWIAIATGAVMANVAGAAETLAVDPAEAHSAILRSWERILAALRRGVTWKNFRSYRRLLEEVAHDLAGLKLKMPLSEASRVMITGEIYVRLVRLTTQPIRDRLVRDGFVVVEEPATNWVRYIDHLQWAGLEPDREKLRGTAKYSHWLKMYAEGAYERSITRALAGSGLVESHVDDIGELLRVASPHVDPLFGGEAILTVGGALDQALERFAGVIVIGPFGCMPTRIASAILAYALTPEEKVRLRPGDPAMAALAREIARCPILFYEADGAQLPPISESQLEVFSLVAKKVGQAMRRARVNH